MPGAKIKTKNGTTNGKAAAENFRLVVDIGNTHTVAGLFNGPKIQRHWRLATRKDTTIDEIAFWLRGANIHPPLRGIVMASVVPTQDTAWLSALEEVFHLQPRVLDYRDCLDLKLDYEIPSQIGADRLANVLGAEALGIEEGVIIDFGTATTFDVFSKHTYYGGIICPGIQTGLRTLVHSAAKLSEPELRWPLKAVGRNTDDALRIGILHGTVGMVESLLKNILAEKRMKKPVVLSTGGLAIWMRGRTKTINRFEPDLTLMGMNHLLSGQKKRRSS